jgi:hypothetical protein
MALLKDDQIPKRKSKPKDNPWDRHADFVALKAAVSNGRMKPLERLGMAVEEYGDGKKMGQKFPARSATDSLRRFIRSLNLQADYHVEKYETNTPGVWMVTVTYEPPIAAGKKAH